MSKQRPFKVSDIIDILQKEIDVNGNYEVGSIWYEPTHSEGPRIYFSKYDDKPKERSSPW